MSVMLWLPVAITVDATSNAHSSGRGRRERATLRPLATSSGIAAVAMNSGHAPRPYRFVT